VKTIAPLMIGLTLVLPGLAQAAEYTDKHLTRSMELILMERAYQAGHGQYGPAVASKPNYVDGADQNPRAVEQDGAGKQAGERQQSDRSRDRSAGTGGNQSARDSQMQSGERTASNGSGGGSGHMSGKPDSSIESDYKGDSQKKPTKTARVDPGSGPVETDPYEVMNRVVVCNMRAKPLGDIMKCLAPDGWAVDLAIHNEKIMKSLYDVTTQRPSRQAVKEFINKVSKTTEVPLTVNFYSDVVDRNGAPQPTIVVTEVMN